MTEVAAASGGLPLGGGTQNRDSHGNTEAPDSGDEDNRVPAQVPRTARTIDVSKRMAEGLKHSTLLRVPRCVAAKVETAWTESLEGRFAGNSEWEFLAKYRSRLLLAHMPQGVDRNTDLKRRLRIWEQGRLDELVLHVAGQQVGELRRRQRDVASSKGDLSEERRGKNARKKATAGAISKAVKSLVEA